MPKGSPNSQTIASAKYHAKKGIITKSFALKKDLCEEFKEACAAAGVSQASQISKMMREFIEEVKSSPKV